MSLLTVQDVNKARVAAERSSIKNLLREVGQLPALANYLNAVRPMLEETAFAVLARCSAVVIRAYRAVDFCLTSDDVDVLGIYLERIYSRSWRGDRWPAIQRRLVCMEPALDELLDDAKRRLSSAESGIDARAVVVTIGAAIVLTACWFHESAVENRTSDAGEQKDRPPGVPIPGRRSLGQTRGSHRTRTVLGTTKSAPASGVSE
jgi:hypothetical protein